MASEGTSLPGGGGHGVLLEAAALSDEVAGRSEARGQVHCGRYRQPCSSKQGSSLPPLLSRVVPGSASLGSLLASWAWAMCCVALLVGLVACGEQPRLSSASRTTYPLLPFMRARLGSQLGVGVVDHVGTVSLAAAPGKVRSQDSQGQPAAVSSMLAAQQEAIRR